MVPTGKPLLASPNRLLAMASQEAKNNRSSAKRSTKTRRDADKKSRSSTRARFDTSELSRVLDCYDLGAIREVRLYNRGSHQAPKALVRADAGDFLLKRRAQEHNKIERVAFCHQVQLRLAEQGYPLAHLIGTRDDNSSMLERDGQVYELFEYITGENYDGSVEQTIDAGYQLARLHRGLAGYPIAHKPKRDTYHDSPTVNAAFAEIGYGTPEEGQIPIEPAPGDQPINLRTVVKLGEAYQRAAEQVRSLGLAKLPRMIVHGDWHPGNALFEAGKVKAIIDFDSAHVHPRLLDIANGTLQYAILGGGEDPEHWPDELDLPRLINFLSGYVQAGQTKLHDVELRILPWLMIEALIAESVLPIAATGSFGRIRGSVFLAMVERKVGWMTQRGDLLRQAINKACV